MELEIDGVARVPETGKVECRGGRLRCGAPASSMSSSTLFTSGAAGVAVAVAGAVVRRTSFFASQRIKTKNVLEFHTQDSDTEMPRFSYHKRNCCGFFCVVIASDVFCSGNFVSYRDSRITSATAVDFSVSSSLLMFFVPVTLYRTEILVS